MLFATFVICELIPATVEILFVGVICPETVLMLELLELTADTAELIPATVLTAPLIPATVVKLALSEVDNQVFSK